MKPRGCSRVLELTCLAALLGWPLATAPAQQTARVQWIWLDEGDPLKAAPAQTCYFRKHFSLGWPADEATLDITAASEFTVWLNGVKVGSGRDWRRVYAFDVVKYMRRGENVLAVAVRHRGGPAGLIVRLGYTPSGQSRAALLSDVSWHASKTAGEGWEQPAFKDDRWKAVRVLGPYGRTGPWQGLTWDSGGDDRFAVPPGFRVEMAVKNPNARDPFSLLNLTFDNRGRLLVSQEGGPVLLCTGPNRDGVFESVKPYCDQVRGCQGMCWVKNALLLVGDGPQGTGLYRVRDTKGQDRTDEVKLLHKFVGSMGEHGPHAILQGPDGWLYLVVGNGAWAKPDRLAANSPLTRWPKGQRGPDQGKPGSTEDILLPRLDEAHGLDARTLAPGGTIWRLDQDGKNLALVVAGLRNAYDAAFSPDGELFTFDSDMEWDVGLPWYRAVRVCHCPPGADFLWRDGSANTPDYYLDSLPPVLETGRGSPVGLAFYNHRLFPPNYQGALFMGDWALGLIYAVHLERQGATYRAQAERFCRGSPMNVTDLAVGPDGALYFTMGGRRTQGGVYRIVSVGRLNLVQPARANRPVSEQQLLSTASRDHPRPLEALLRDLQNPDPFVCRRACEELVRANQQPPVEAVWPLLGNPDRFVCTAARLVLQRIAPSKWIDRLWREANDRIVCEGIIALCKTNQAAGYGEPIFRLLSRQTAVEWVPGFLDFLRTLQLALIHTDQHAGSIRAIATRLFSVFPHQDARINRELAILLAQFRRDGQLDQPVHRVLLTALLNKREDRPQQIHYFYCLRLLPDGWTTDQKQALLAWYDATNAWQGGHNFSPFLENIFRDLNPIFTPDDRSRLLAEGERFPWAATGLLRMSEPEQLPSPALLARLFERLSKKDMIPRKEELKEAIVAALGRAPQPTAQAFLRAIADKHPEKRDAVARGLARFPVPENWPYLIRGLESSNPLVVFDVLEGLKKNPSKPPPDDPIPYRAVLLASGRLDVKNRWKAVELLRHWTNDKQFGAEKDAWGEELAAWSKWFAQTFPREPALPAVAVEKPAQSRYKFDELLAFLEKDPAGRKGDPVRGRKLFEKAQCLKCHRFGKEGEGVGPDLTTVSQRFGRADILESILYPSKVISDQYRSTLFVTKKGQQINGLASPQGDSILVLLSDGTKVSLKKDEIEQQFASLISVMPERLLDSLSREEIADLFAFLEAGPR